MARFLSRWLRSHPQSVVNSKVVNLRPRLDSLEDRNVPSAVAPNGVVAQGISASAIQLTWNPSIDASVTGYEVLEKVWVKPRPSPRGSPTGGHYVYNVVANNLPGTSDTITGLATGSTHTYVVVALAPTGPSAYSIAASAQTWIAPNFTNGPSYYLLGGAVWSGIANATAGQQTQAKLLVSGNPLNFSVVSGPAGLSIDATGAISYIPLSADVGSVSATFQVSNALGSLTQTINFDVAPNPNPVLPIPTLQLYGSSGVYNGAAQGIGGYATGTSGAYVAGIMTFSYGASGVPTVVGDYTITANFMSADPNYANTSATFTYTVTQAIPTITLPATTTIAVGTSSTTIKGTISSGSAAPGGQSIAVTLGGVTTGAVVDQFGNFTATIVTSAIPVGTSGITVSYAGDKNFAAATATSTLVTIPTAAPVITLNPRGTQVTVGDPVTLRAAATGSPTPNVQWQVSRDGGLTWISITGNLSAQTATLSFTSSLVGKYQYRAVFSNPYGTVITTVATVTFVADGGGA